MSTSQSSIQGVGVSEGAVDGNSDGDYDSGRTCTPTVYGWRDPWLWADMGSSQSVSEVLLVNRVHIHKRLVNIEIRVGMKITN